LYFYSELGKKSAVTHVFRHNFVSDLANSGNDTENIKQFIGHKSIKSTEHYVNKNKKNNQSN
jgi:site-specific recombinase XerD